MRWKKAHFVRFTFKVLRGEPLQQIVQFMVGYSVGCVHERKFPVVG